MWANVYPDLCGHMVSVGHPWCIEFSVKAWVGTSGSNHSFTKKWVYISWSVNSSPPSAAAAYMHQWANQWLALAQVTACRLFGTKPLPEPMLTYYTPPPPPPPPPPNEVVGGILVSLRPSVRLSVRPSRILCPLYSAYSFSWIHFIYIYILSSNFRRCVACKVFGNFFKTYSCFDLGCDVNH